MRQYSVEELATLERYLANIRAAKVYEVARRTPLEIAPSLSLRMDNTILLKREDQQPVFSFKCRGAFNKMASLTEEQRQKGVICASAGNHAQGVALSAQYLGCRAVIVMPSTTPAVKVNAVTALGAEIILHGDTYSDAAAKADELNAAYGYTFIHPFDDEATIAGQGTIAEEILSDHEGDLEAIFVPVGGGGLVSGVAAYVKAVRPEVRVIGVQSADSDAMVQSLAIDHRVGLSDVGLFCDGTAVKMVGEITFNLTRSFVDEFVTVDNDEVCAAINDVFYDTRSILEPAGALSIAGCKRYIEESGATGKTFACIASGANMNFDRLRFVAERSEEKEVLFAVTIPERMGSFRGFSALIGQRAITEFNYRISDANEAHVFVGLTTTNQSESSALVAAFTGAGLSAIDLTHDELAKDHVRHMVGGRTEMASDERLFRFLFPERPGALMDFLSRLHSDWNITLFHYRNQGADYGRVLVGLQTPKGDETELTAFLENLSFPYEDESNNPVYKLFLR